ncbi:apolipoprotein acyltransferase [Aporhodopirellula aestuarii]|uniref:Apolipoprotein acyltransferase n=1 Tax=Aporhodopirellula aestuarii TaxID=2950107 RepID=A0ABT0U6C9_9BACT|nr:apolipoprotein acyltransferase [Aporhodopirellula aestuarii]MCM2372507.1 apolipoprotein acyltransferase [Aporhodopirellula aestuarii]
MTDSLQPDLPTDDLSDAHREVLRRMGECVGKTLEEVRGPDDLIGFFQSFRPDGRGLAGVFSGLPGGDEVHERIATLFEVAGDDRRPGGGRDAFFVVRQPAVIDPDEVQAAGESWIASMKVLAESLGHSAAKAQLTGVDRVRVLEGIPPKHPKLPDEKTALLNLLSDGVPSWLAQATPQHAIAEALRGPFYFINCDAMLRDYLMWPLYRDHVSLDDPFEPYFRLWRHGIKWRVFQDTQVDLYMPRH